jgi:gp32 DNA binding protein like
MSFANLKRNRTDLTKLVEDAKKAAGGTGEREASDDRFWVPTRDKAGNGYAVIRFLPGKEENGTPWIRYWDHAFKGPTGQWYIEKSLTSLGQNDPVSELNMKMWNESAENSPERKIVSSRKRNLRYVANVLVITDQQNPANDGQVKLYRFGKKIFDKIMAAMQPQFPDEKPINPFDMWEGADFVLKISSESVGGRMMPKYDASYFKAGSKLFDGDEAKLEAIYDKQYPMGEWVDPANYKSYDQLRARLTLVLGESAPRSVRETVSLDETAPAPSFKAAENVNLSEADEDDTMSFFAKLANDD